jgi:hypothetical protein
MCERLILDGTQYICSDCLTELKAFKESLPERMTIVELTTTIYVFMRTQPGTYMVVDTNEAFDELIGEKKKEY